MQLSTETLIRDLAGEAVKEHQGGPDASLRSVCIGALLASYPDEQTLPGVDKVKRFQLALDFQNAKETGVLNISLEDAVLLKKLIGKAYAPLIVGRVFELLDGS